MVYDKQTTIKNVYRIGGHTVYLYNMRTFSKKAA